MNHGLNSKRELAEQSGEDWLNLGGISRPSMVFIPPEERLEYFPKGELQRAQEDTMSCASYAPVNILECYFSYMLQNDILTSDETKWLNDEGYIVEDRVLFSNAFVAINSNTTREGNSLKAPLESIRKQGLIPKHFLSLESTMTWEEFHGQDISPQMFSLGLDFLDKFEISYEKVYNFALDVMLDVGGHAWPEPEDGVYPRTEFPFNHAFVRIKTSHVAGDTYPDSFDGDYFKELAPDYKFLDYGYRIMINRGKPRNRNWLCSFINKFK